MSRIRSSFVVLLAVAGLVLALDHATLAATGGSLLLGRSNSADRTTVLTNTGNGSALSLRTRVGQPPLAVSSRGRVTNLNADSVDGRQAADLANVVRRYTLTPSGSLYMTGKTWTLPTELPRGDHLVTVNTSLTAPGGASDLVANVQCRARLGSATDFAGQMVAYSNGFAALLSFSGLVRVTAVGGTALFITCDSNIGSFALATPLVVTVSPVDLVSEQGLLNVN